MGALLLLMLAQSPQAPGDVAVVVSSRREPAAAQKVARALAEVLAPSAHVLSDDAAKARVAELGGVDPVTCDGARQCLSKLAELLGPHATVIGVDVAKAGRFQSCHIEAVASGKGESLLADDFTSDTKAFEAQSKQWARSFGERLQVKLSAWNQEIEAAKPKVAPTPPNPIIATNPEPVLVAPPPPPPPLLVEQPPPARTPAWVCTVVAGAGAISTGVLLGLGLSAKARYDNSVRTFLIGTDNASTLTWSQLNQTVDRANNELGISLGLGIVTALAATLALYFFLR